MLLRDTWEGGTKHRATDVSVAHRCGVAVKLVPDDSAVLPATIRLAGLRDFPSQCSA